MARMPYILRRKTRDFFLDLGGDRYIRLRNFE